MTDKDSTCEVRTVNFLQGFDAVGWEIEWFHRERLEDEWPNPSMGGGDHRK